MTESWPRRLARRALVYRVRAHAPKPPQPDRRGSDWGEAMIAEFEQTAGAWEAARWTASAWRAARTLAPLPARVRLRRRLIVAVAAAGLLLAPVNAYAATISYIPSGAMEPTLRVEDRVLIEKISFRWTGVRHGDIVVVRMLGEDMIKRVLGLPGDDIACRNGALLRNGVPVRESYLLAGAVTECTPMTVPADTLYLLGDHREASADSRRWGAVPATAVVGRVVMRF